MKDEIMNRAIEDYKENRTAHPLIFITFDPFYGHQYQCPCCGKLYYTRDLCNKDGEARDNFECDRCKIILTCK